MIVDVRFPYAAAVVPRRGARTTWRTYHDVVPVAIAEYVDREAPVAIRLDCGRNIHEIRAIDGRLYSPVVASRKDVSWDGTHRNAAWLAAKARPVSSGPDPFDVNAGYLDRCSKERDGTPQDDKVFEVIESEYGRRVAGVLNAAERMILVDGLVWRKTSEPILVRQDGYGGTSFGFAASAFASASSVYRIDQADLVRSTFPRAFVPFVEVLDPTVVRYRADERFLVEAGCLLASKMALFSERSPTLRAAYETYVEILDDARGMVDHGDCDWRGLAEATERAMGDLRAASGGPDSLRPTLDECEEALSRFEGNDRDESDMLAP